MGDNRRDSNGELYLMAAGAAFGASCFAPMEGVLAPIEISLIDRL
jgi:hypothetical protein